MSIPSGWFTAIYRRSLNSSRQPSDEEELYTSQRQAKRLRFYMLGRPFKMPRPLVPQSPVVGSVRHCILPQVSAFQ